MTTVLCLALALVTADASANWPGFLGAGEARATVQSLPLKWAPSENIAWQAKLPGDGQSSPVVWGDTAFVTAVEGDMKDTCHVIAIAVNDGKIRWQHAFESSDKVKSSLYVSRAAPTAAVDAQAVYAFFESGDVVALSHDGKELWRRSLSNDYGKFKNKFGLSASPVLTDNAVIILIDDEGPSYLVALAKADGKVLWKTDRTSRVSWSSPGVVTAAGKPMVVCSSAGSVDGYDPQTGELLWTFDEVGGNTSSTPMMFDEGKFLVGATAGREGDDAGRAALSKKSNMAMSIELVDGKPTPRVLWRATSATPTFGSPMVHAGHAYWINRVGVVYCLDAATGEVRYTERLKQPCWATPLGVGDRVYFFGKDGLTTVLKAGEKFEVLAENQLWDPESVKSDPEAAAKEEPGSRRDAAANFSGPVQYGIAARDGLLLIRTGSTLYCIRE